MSSVVIAGNTSGSVTLDAPAVAGTTVLTLPATSGTVVTTATSTGISGSAISTGTVGVSVGGTGANTLTANNVILGNGTSAVQFVAPGSNGNVLTSNGTTWTSAAAASGQFQTQLFTAPGTWTKPSSCTQVRVTVVGGGGGGVNTGPGVTGGTSSFGALVSATGGAGQVPSPAPGRAMGTGTVSSGTSIRTSSGQTLTTGLGGPITIGGSVSGPGASLTSPVVWSAASQASAGAGNGTVLASAGGFGGVAVASNVPVSSPVAVTVGAGGASGGGPGYNAGDGAVLVEFVG